MMCRIYRCALRSSVLPRLIVSLGSGTTESRDICLCLEKDAKSVFSACASLKVHCTANKTSFVARCDYTSPRLADLIRVLKEALKANIIVLFQHPNLAMKQSLVKASKSVLKL